MKILYVTPKLSIGDNPRSSFIREELQFLAKNVNITVLQINVGNPLSILFELMKKIPKEKNSIDLIHAHFAFPYGFVAYQLSRLIDKPFIVTVHGFDVQVHHELKYGISRYRVFKYLIRQTLNRSSAVIANSTSLIECCERLGVQRNRIKLIHHGVDLSKFSPKFTNQFKLPFFSDSSCFYILCVARQEKIKGIECLIKGFKILLDKLSGKFKVHLILVGWGKRLTYNRRLCYELGLSRYVSFLGAMPRRYMPFLYNLADVVVAPSLIEGFGLSVAEAMACEKPVIATAVGGHLDQIVDGFNGFLVPPNDPLTLAERLEFLIYNPDIRIKLGKNARKVCKEKFDINKRIKAILDLYEMILSIRT